MLLLICAAAYSNTLDASFHLDDRDYIPGNPWFKSFTLWPDPAKFDRGMMTNSNVTDTLRTRYVAYLTLYANVLADGLRGFHLVNIAIHFINSVLVYLLVLLMLATPRMRGSTLSAHRAAAALIAAALFAAHPIETQAVTYISQRFTSLCAAFYLGSLVAYAGWRLRGGLARYALALICAVCAMMTKEIAFTLPVAVVLYEAAFFEGGWRERLRPLAPILATMLIIPFWTIAASGGSISAATGRAASGLTRADYLITQITVVPEYLRLIFLPAGQNIDYDWPVYRSLLDTRVLASAAFLVLLLAASVWAYRTRRPGLRVAAYGVWWFFVTLSVESSVFPLNDMIFEHRAYLPSAGIIIAVVALGFEFVRPRAVMVVSAALVAALGVAAYERNAVWHDEISLWSDAVSKSPLKRRPHFNLSIAYRAAGDNARADEQYRAASALPHDTLDTGPAAAQPEQATDNDDEIVEHFKAVLGINADLSEVYDKLGRAHEAKGETYKAIAMYRKAVAAKPGYAQGHADLAAALYAGGLTSEAITELREAIRLDPRLAEAHNNLGICYMETGQTEAAIREFDAALAIDPTLTQTRELRQKAEAQLSHPQ